jgi:hypothetical protein
MGGLCPTPFGSGFLRMLSTGQYRHYCTANLPASSAAEVFARRLAKKRRTCCSALMDEGRKRVYTPV